MANAATNLGTNLANYAYSQGNPLQQKLGDASTQAQALQLQQGEDAVSYYKRLMESGGYTPDQAKQIVGQANNGNVPGLDQLASLSPDEAASNFQSADTQQANFLTPGEQSGIEGNPNDPLGYLHSDTIGQYMQEGGEKQDQAVNDLGEGLRGSIDAGRLRQGAGYAGNVASTLGGASAKIDAATGNPALDLGKNFAQDTENSAAQDVANVSEGRLEDVERRNAGAGIGPLGMAAARLRTGRQAASDAADAATKARIGAEQTRLGAAQNKAGLQTQGAEYEGTTGLGALHDTEAMRIGAEQGLTQDQMQAELASGQADVANRQRETDTNIGAVENVRNAEVGAHTTAEQAAAARAAALATNRQGVSQANAANNQTTRQQNNAANYNRGASANTALSQRYGTVANTGLQQQNLGGQGILSEQGINAGNQNTAQGQQLQAFGDTTNAAGNAANIVSGSQNQPGTGSKILGGVLGAISAFADGGIATEPTTALLGEAGPEAVIPLSGAGGSQDSRPIGGTDAPQHDLFADPNEQIGSPEIQGDQDMNMSPGFRRGLNKVAQVAGGINAGMNGQPPPNPNGGTGTRPNLTGIGNPQAAPVAPWKRNLQRVGQVASGVNAGMNGQQPTKRPRYGSPPPAIPPGIGVGPPPSSPGVSPLAPSGMSNAGIAENAQNGAQAPPPGGGTLGALTSPPPFPMLGSAPPPPTTPPSQDMGEGLGDGIPPPPPPGGRMRPGQDPGMPMARGGIVTRPTRAIIGDAGPEAVVPLNPRGMGGLRMRPSAIPRARYGT